MNNTIIKLEHVSKEYHRGTETVHAVNDVSCLSTKENLWQSLVIPDRENHFAQYYRLP